MTYLQALKNTGITLQQFTEAETLELEDTPFGFPDLRKVVKVEEEEVVQEEGVVEGEKRGRRRDDFNLATRKTIRRGREERSQTGRFQSGAAFVMFPCSPLTIFCPYTSAHE
ncbi:hypothetical protein NE237_014049 [Protea cynaroides]|uniref:Uncharacterized protein n=1 Tax=Protea cynaroides TaxID=273540 RepID=A0A9Q0H248_9MAGN|nr:hypothetical protein NE237_014049 [Protea cynaroides]